MSAGKGQIDQRDSANWDVVASRRDRETLPEVGGAVEKNKEPNNLEGMVSVFQREVELFAV